MKIEQIIYLNDIKNTHSISQTAQRFFISQQALNVSLTKLEEEFGIPLLTRTNKGVELTEAGLLFLQKGNEILNIYRELKDTLYINSAEAFIGTPTGCLDIFCHTKTLAPFLIDILEIYSQKYPDVAITLQEKENIEIINMISEVQGDCGIIFAPEYITKNFCESTQSYQLPPNISIEKLFSDRFVICCNIHHAITNYQHVTINSFPDTPIIFFDKELYREDATAKSAATQNNIYYSDNILFHTMMLQRGLAISTITAFEFRKLFAKYKDLTVVPIEESPEAVISIVTNTKKPLSLATQLFIELLRKYDFYGII